MDQRQLSPPPRPDDDHLGTELFLGKPQLPVAVLAPLVDNQCNDQQVGEFGRMRSVVERLRYRLPQSPGVDDVLCVGVTRRFRNGVR